MRPEVDPGRRGANSVLCYQFDRVHRCINNKLHFHSIYTKEREFLLPCPDGSIWRYFERVDARCGCSIFYYEQEKKGAVWLVYRA